MKSRATGDGDSVTGESAGCGSVLTGLAVLLAPPHPHCDLRGMAAVMLEHPQLCGCRCGHAVSGRPGFLTGTIRRSLACVHFVERWPRMHGSLNTDVSFRARKGQAYVIPGHLHAVYDRHLQNIMSSIALCGSEKPAGVGASYARFHAPEKRISLFSKSVTEQSGNTHAPVAPPSSEVDLRRGLASQCQGVGCSSLGNVYR